MANTDQIQARIRELGSENKSVTDIQFTISREFGITLQSARGLVILCAFADAAGDIFDELAGGAPSPNRGKNNNNQK